MNTSKSWSYLDFSRTDVSYPTHDQYAPHGNTFLRAIGGTMTKVTDGIWPGLPFSVKRIDGTSDDQRAS